MTIPIKIIGLGLSRKDLTQHHLSLIKKADVLVGGRRHLALFPEFSGETKIIDKDLKGLTDFIKTCMQDNRIVVLASGDPLYFGIGAFLVKALGSKRVEILANIPAIAAAFARIKAPWQDVPVISLHGREDQNRLWEVLTLHETVAIYTDTTKNPAWIAGLLMEKDWLDVNLCVLERLGDDSERVDWYTPEQAARMSFADPNVVIVKRKTPVVKATKDRFLGMPEEWFAHEKGLITKAEVRAVTLSKLRLEARHTLWDLGAGSGSISIEAALFITAGQIFALEKESERIKQIETNLRHFGIHNISIKEANLPDGLEDLPIPDRVFIGGGGRHLGTIIRRVDDKLVAGGVMVINTVLLQNVDTALTALEERGYRTEGVQVQVSRVSKMPYGQRLSAQNPVWVITGTKPG